MKTQFLNFLVRATVLSAMLIVTSVASVQGQSLSTRARFNIPFDFAFGETKLPAGKYSIGRALQSSDDLIQSLADQKGRSQAAVLSHAVLTSQPDTEASLVFHRYGDQYFLVQVWPAGGNTGREFRASKLEREVQQHLVRISSPGKVAESAKYQVVVLTTASQ